MVILFSAVPVEVVLEFCVGVRYVLHLVYSGNLVGKIASGRFKGTER